MLFPATEGKVQDSGKPDLDQTPGKTAVEETAYGSCSQYLPPMKIFKKRLDKQASAWIGLGAANPAFEQKIILVDL